MKKVNEIHFLPEDHDLGTNWLQHFLTTLILKELDLPAAIAPKVIYEITKGHKE